MNIDSTLNMQFELVNSEFLGMTLLDHHSDQAATPSTGGYTQHWWLHTTLVVTHNTGGYTQHWWLHTMLVVTHNAGGYTQHWWLHTTLVVTHNAGGYRQRWWLHWWLQHWWLHTTLVVTHNTCLWDQCVGVKPLSPLLLPHNLTIFSHTFLPTSPSHFHLSSSHYSSTLPRLTVKHTVSICWQLNTQWVYVDS